MIRFAIYYTPESGSDLDKAACQWLGRDRWGTEVARVAGPDGLPSARVDELLAAPRHYGFHGTIKPPFRLKGGTTVDELQAQLAVFAASQKPFVLPPLTVQELGRFLCLGPTAPSGRLDRLAARVVQDFDHFRAPPSAAELARRRSTPLTEQQEEVLLAWGYPYVLEEFRFHLTLTSPVDDLREKELLFRELSIRFPQAMLQQLLVGGLALFMEVDGAAFEMIEYFPFT